MTKQPSVLEHAFITLIYQLLQRETQSRVYQLKSTLDGLAAKFNAKTDELIMVVKTSPRDDRWFVIERPDRERLLTAYTGVNTGLLQVDFSPKMLVQELNDTCNLLNIVVPQEEDVK